MTSADQLNSPQRLQEQCFEAWAEHNRQFADRRPCGQVSKSQVWAMSDWAIGDLRLRQFSTGGEEIVRRHEHVRRSFTEHIALYVVLSGVRHAIIDDGVLSMQPDQIIVHDLNLPSRYSTLHSLSALVINVPYSAIGYDPSSHRRALSISSGTPVGRMLHDAIMTIYRQTAKLQQTEAPALAAGFNGLLNGLLMPHSANEEARTCVSSARLKLVQAYIEEHILNPDLNTTEICRVFGASRATIYRLFQPEGGVAHYIRERRLVHALRRLCAVPATRGQVRAIAESLGFEDHSHFNRLFRSKFDIAPSDAMGLWLAPRQHRPDPRHS